MTKTVSGAKFQVIATRSSAIIERMTSGFYTVASGCVDAEDVAIVNPSQGAGCWEFGADGTVTIIEVL